MKRYIEMEAIMLGSGGGVSKGYVDAGDVSSLQRARDYADSLLALGDRAHYDPDMGISSPNWDAGVNYVAGMGVNYHYRGFTALAANTNSAPYEGSPYWGLEADDYVAGGSYEAYGAGGGASGGRGFIVVDGYGLYCTENTVLTQSDMDAVVAFVNGLPFPVVSWPVTGAGIAGAEHWRILYGWPYAGRFQLSFYDGGVLRWVDPRVQLGLADVLDPAGNDPVTGRGIAEYLAATVSSLVYPVGIVVAFGNATDPNVVFAPQSWQKMPNQRFLRGVTGSPGGTGGSNAVTQVLSHTHTLGTIITESAGNHKHQIRRDNSTPPGYLPGQANPQAIMSNAGNPPSHNGAFSDRAGTDYNNGAALVSEAGSHTHTIAAGTVVSAPAGAVTSIDNQPAYVDVVFWKRTV